MMKSQSMNQDSTKSDSITAMIFSPKAQTFSSVQINIDSVSPRTSSNAEQAGQDTSVSLSNDTGGFWSRLGHLIIVVIVGVINVDE